MEWFNLFLTIFYALTIGINIAGIVASLNAIKEYQKSLDMLHECEAILSIFEKYRKQG